MEEVKIVVMEDTGRVMAQFDDGTLVPLRLYNTNGIYVDYLPNKKETNYA